MRILAGTRLLTFLVTICGQSSGSATPSTYSPGNAYGEQSYGSQVTYHPKGSAEKFYKSAGNSESAGSSGSTGSSSSSANKISYYNTQPPHSYPEVGLTKPPKGVKPNGGFHDVIDHFHGNFDPREKVAMKEEMDWYIQKHPDSIYNLSPHQQESYQSSTVKQSSDGGTATPPLYSPHEMTQGARNTPSYLRNSYPKPQNYIEGGSELGEDRLIPFHTVEFDPSGSRGFKRVPHFDPVEFHPGSSDYPESSYNFGEYPQSLPPFKPSQPFLPGFKFPTLLSGFRASFGPPSKTLSIGHSEREKPSTELDSFSTYEHFYKKYSKVPYDLSTFQQNPDEPTGFSTQSQVQNYPSSKTVRSKSSKVLYKDERDESKPHEFSLNVYSTSQKPSRKVKSTTTPPPEIPSQLYFLGYNEPLADPGTNAELYATHSFTSNNNPVIDDPSPVLETEEHPGIYQGYGQTEPPYSTLPSEDHSVIHIQYPLKQTNLPSRSGMSGKRSRTSIKRPLGEHLTLNKEGEEQGNKWGVSSYQNYLPAYPYSNYPTNPIVQGVKVPIIPKAFPQRLTSPKIKSSDPHSSGSLTDFIPRQSGFMMTYAPTYAPYASAPYDYAVPSTYGQYRVDTTTTDNLLRSYGIDPHSSEDQHYQQSETNTGTKLPRTKKRNSKVHKSEQEGDIGERRSSKRTRRTRPTTTGPLISQSTTTTTVPTTTTTTVPTTTTTTTVPTTTTTTTVPTTTTTTTVPTTTTTTTLPTTTTTTTVPTTTTTTTVPTTTTTTTLPTTTTTTTLPTTTTTTTLPTTTTPVPTTTTTVPTTPTTVSTTTTPISTTSPSTKLPSSPTVSTTLLTRLRTGDVSVKGEDKSIEGEDESIEGEDESVEGEDESVEGEDEGIEGEDKGKEPKSQKEVLINLPPLKVQPFIPFPTTEESSMALPRLILEKLPTSPPESGNLTTLPDLHDMNPGSQASKPPDSQEEEIEGAPSQESQEQGKVREDDPPPVPLHFESGKRTELQGQWEDQGHTPVTNGHTGKESGFPSDLPPGGRRKIRINASQARKKLKEHPHNIIKKVKKNMKKKSSEIRDVIN